MQCQRSTSFSWCKLFSQAYRISYESFLVLHNKLNDSFEDPDYLLALWIVWTAVIIRDMNLGSFHSVIFLLCKTAYQGLYPCIIHVIRSSAIRSMFPLTPKMGRDYFSTILKKLGVKLGPPSWKPGD